MTRMEESMRELKMVADGSLKRIMAVERRLEAPPPPPPLPPPPATGTYPMPLGKTVTGKYPPMTEKLVDPLVFSNHLRGETRYKGTWKGYSVPPPPHILRTWVCLILLLLPLTFARIQFLRSILPPHILVS
jgi:hypothetical protein